jgi:hypothetical protein
MKKTLTAAGTCAWIAWFATATTSAAPRLEPMSVEYQDATALVRALGQPMEVAAVRRIARELTAIRKLGVPAIADLHSYTDFPFVLTVGLKSAEAGKVIARIKAALGAVDVSGISYKVKRTGIESIDHVLAGQPVESIEQSTYEDTTDGSSVYFKVRTDQMKLEAIDLPGLNMSLKRLPEVGNLDLERVERINEHSPIQRLSDEGGVVKYAFWAAVGTEDCFAGCEGETTRFEVDTHGEEFVAKLVTEKSEKQP